MKEADFARLTPPTQGEIDMLDHARAPRHSNSRLSCQILVTEALEGLTTAAEASTSFVYLLGFDRLDARQAAWAGFYGDPQWQQVRAATNAGSEMIERTALSFLSPSAACDGVDSRCWSGGVHELVDQRVAIGRKAAVEAFLAEVYVPALRASGADVLWLAEAITGEDLPQFSYILRWRNPEDRRAAQPLLEGTARPGGSLLLGARSMEMQWMSP